MGKYSTHPWQKEGSHLSSSWEKGRLPKVTSSRTSLIILPYYQGDLILDS